MKKQKFELSHDIIAEKIWRRLPEQDKQLRKIQRSIAQRQEDYQAGKGGLIGKEDLDAWKAYLPMLELSAAQKMYVDKSVEEVERKQKEEEERLEREKRQIKRNKNLQRWIAIVLFVATLLSLFFIWRATQEGRNAAKALKDSELAIKRVEAEKARADTAKKEATLANNIARQKEIEAQQKTEEANEARKQAELAEFNAEEAIELANQKTEEARMAQNEADQAIQRAQAAQEKARVSRASYLASEGQIAFSDQDYPRGFRLLQEAQKVDTQNDLALDRTKIYAQHLAKFDWENVIDFKLSPERNFIAIVVQEEDIVILKVYQLRTGKNEILTSSPLHGSNHQVGSYSDSYRFSEKGRYLACLIKKGEETLCVVYSLTSFSPDRPILTTPPLQKSSSYSDSGSYSYSYIDSYEFSEGEKHMACLIKKGVEALCTIYSLTGYNPDQPILTSSPLEISDSSSYSGSYRFSKGGKYMACLIKKGEKALCIVYSLTGSNPAQLILSTPPLQKSNRYTFFSSYSNSYRFSEEGGHLACLVKKGEETLCLVYSLTGSSPDRPILTTPPLQKSDNDNQSDSYIYSYRFSRGGGHMACLIKKGAEALCTMYSLTGSSPDRSILTTPPLQKSGSEKSDRYSNSYSSSYRDSYRFSEEGGHMACLIKKGEEALCTVYSLTVPSPGRPIITTSPLQNSDSDILRSSTNYSNSYRFSRGGGYMSILIKKRAEALCVVYSLTGSNPAQLILSTPPLQKSNRYTLLSSYSNSYRFSEGDRHMACLVKKGAEALCVVYSLTGSNPAQLILSTPPLQKSSERYSDSYSNLYTFLSSYSNSYRFSEGDRHMACLIKKGKEVLCTVYSLTVPKPDQPILSSAPLQKSDGESYSDSYRFRGSEGMFFREDNGRTLRTISFEDQKSRRLQDLSEIDKFEVTADQKYVAYLTKHQRLKVVDITIPEEDLIDYYNKILPPLTKEEKEKYGILE